MDQFGVALEAEAVAEAVAGWRLAAYSRFIPRNFKYMVREKYIRNNLYFDYVEKSCNQN